MKVYPSNIIQKTETGSINNCPVLFYGSESGLISRLIKSIYSTLKSEIDLFEIKQFDCSVEKNGGLKYILSEISLFSKSNFIVLNKPHDRLIADFENIETYGNYLIINGENINTKSKLKKYFDGHPKFISVPCYPLNKRDVKNIVDDFLKEKKINLKKEPYWFLIENISEDYLTLEGELKKLHTYNDLDLNIDNLQKLIVQKHSFKTDSYFFNCVKGNSGQLLKEISASEMSVSESYEILNTVKKFVIILSQAELGKPNYNIEELVTKYVPKYLFQQKDVFREAFKTINLEKLTRANKMIQKTESLLRKNSEQHKELVGRFLLNLTRIIN